MGSGDWPSKLGAIATTVGVSITVLGLAFAAGMWVCGINHRTSGAVGAECREGTSPAFRVEGQRAIVTCVPGESQQ